MQIERRGVSLATVNALIRAMHEPLLARLFPPPPPPPDWTEDELNTWIDTQLSEDTVFLAYWVYAPRVVYFNGARW